MENYNSKANIQKIAFENFQMFVKILSENIGIQKIFTF